MIATTDATPDATSPTQSCQHTPVCPDAAAADHTAARTVATYPVQGWSLLCNGVIVFDDAGELMPDGASVSPRR